jgi:hypothetical protein
MGWGSDNGTSKVTGACNQEDYSDVSDDEALSEVSDDEGEQIPPTRRTPVMVKAAQGRSVSMDDDAGVEAKDPSRCRGYLPGLAVSADTGVRKTVSRQSEIVGHKQRTSTPDNGGDALRANGFNEHWVKACGAEADQFHRLFNPQSSAATGTAALATSRTSSEGSNKR